MYTQLETYSTSNYKNTVNYKMHLGASDFDSSTKLTASDWFTTERSNTPGVTAKESYNSSTLFVGSVGLMYPSDYGYAALSSDCARTINLRKYDETAACHDNNWLYQDSSDTQWLISPHSSYANSAFYVERSEDVFFDTSQVPFPRSASYSPVMALKSDIMVTGSGTQNAPYIMYQ